MNRLPQASWLLRRELADDDGVIAAAALLERGAHDAVVSVFRGREDNARIQVVLADVVVLGQDFAFVVFQTQLGVELGAGHVDNVGFAGRHFDGMALLPHFGAQEYQTGNELQFLAPFRIPISEKKNRRLPLSGN